MSNGYWGSKFPISNFICTRIVFAGVWWGITRRRIINALRDKIYHRDVQLVNNGSTKEAIKKWLDAGYDKINIGGGSKNIDRFINVDFTAHPEVDREVVANILDLSFIPSDSISQIHTNHVIEHLAHSQLLDQLKEYHRILRDGGLLTLRCPNALGASYAFWFKPVLERDRDKYVELGFPKDEDFDNPSDGWMHKDLFGLLHWYYGDMGNIKNQHLNIITPSKIKRMVTSSGFRIIKMADPESLNIVIIARKTAGR